MNILVVAAQGLYADYSASFVHGQVKEYVRAGHKVRVIVPVAAGKETNAVKRLSRPIVRTVQDGVEIFYLRYLSLGHLGENTFNPKSAERTVRRYKDALLKDFKPDVIHAHAIFFAGNIGRVLKETCKVPLVITTHGGDTDLALLPDKTAEARTICDSAECVVAVSDVYVEKTRRIGSNTEIRCILNGFNIQNACPGEKKKHSLIQACYLIPRKHVELSIEAASVLREKYPDISLTIVGNGVEQERLEKLTAELGMTDVVNFCGFLPNQEVLKKMAESEIFVLPSVDEGFGIAYIEAMASGCVAIGTEGEGIGSVIKSGENGFLVPANDAGAIAAVIERCFEEPDEAGKITRRGIESARKLTWERNAGQYLELFEKLLRDTRAE